MSIYFNEKFKQLRRAHDLTQEQVADIFHVSPQSVSRWETGANYPDIEILPHIAIFFKVTVDELLGTQRIAGEEKAKEYRRDIRNLLNTGNVGGAVEMARRAVKEYPVNYDLQNHLVQALCTDNADSHKDEIIAVGENIMEYCTDQNTALWTKFLLIRQYAKWGMKDQAKKIVDSMPTEAYYTQDLTLKYVLEGEEWLRNQENSMVRFTIILMGIIDDYGQRADLDALRKIEYTKAAMQIESLVYPLCGEEPDRINRAFLHIRIAALYCEAGKAEEALTHVEKATQDAMHHVSQMYQTTEEGNNYYPWDTKRNLCWILWEDHLTKADFDLICGDERFAKCFDLLKENSREF
ncbi:MAG: helix-turn-helix domain-containing protein [Oscillospiraceae bacterium]|jgi:transcriptional regulator with XRE-family HTH domain|nr:helix-turn-helix domain-containing protein [Oscillospiraceae bacterium]